MSITTLSKCDDTRSSSRVTTSGSNERISAGRLRGDHRQAGGMAAKHDLEQLPVEPLRPRLDLVEVEARLEVEIVGAGAVLEIEIDQAGRRLDRVGAP